MIEAGGCERNGSRGGNERIGRTEVARGRERRERGRGKKFVARAGKRIEGRRGNVIGG